MRSPFFRRRGMRKNGKNKINDKLRQWRWIRQRCLDPYQKDLPTPATVSEIVSGHHRSSNVLIVSDKPNVYEIVSGHRRSNNVLIVSDKPNVHEILRHYCHWTNSSGGKINRNSNRPKSIFFFFFLDADQRVFKLKCFGFEKKNKKFKWVSGFG